MVECVYITDCNFFHFMLATKHWRCFNGDHNFSPSFKNTEKQVFQNESVFILLVYVNEDTAL